jgi:hypothetical protein
VRPLFDGSHRVALEIVSDSGASAPSGRLFLGWKSNSQRLFGTLAVFFGDRPRENQGRGDIRENLCGLICLGERIGILRYLFRREPC